MKRRIELALQLDGNKKTPADGKVVVFTPKATAAKGDDESVPSEVKPFTACKAFSERKEQLNSSEKVHVELSTLDEGKHKRQALIEKRKRKI